MLAACGSLPSKSTAYISSVIGISTPSRRARIRAARVVGTPLRNAAELGLNGRQRDAPRQLLPGAAIATQPAGAGRYHVAHPGEAGKK